MSINTLDRDTLLRQMAQMNERIKKLENTLQGQEVSGVKIKNIKWDRGIGGTLRLGGENDIGGALELYNEFNELQAKLDVNGIAFKDNSSTEGFDSMYQFFGASPGSTVNDSEITFDLKFKTKMFCLFTGTMFGRSSTGQPTFSGNSIITMIIDGVPQVGPRVVRAFNEITAGFFPVVFADMIELEIGEHTLAFRIWTDTANTGETGLYTASSIYLEAGNIF